MSLRLWKSHGRVGGVQATCLGHQWSVQVTMPKQSKQEKADEQSTPDNRRVLLYPTASADTPNAFAHLGFRFGYTLIAWFVLGKGINETSFFVSLNLFVVPILIDCLKFSPTTKIRKYIRQAELFVCGFWFLFSVLGMMGVLIVAKSGDQYLLSTAEDFIGFQLTGIDLRCIWRLVASVTLVTLIDWLFKRTRRDEAFAEIHRTEGES